jgi:hypothetical protein
MRGGGGAGGADRRTVLFVCQHGAGKSRIAAAWFNGAAPAGWWATSAGVEPQATVSVHAPRLLAGTSVEGLLDRALPRPLAAVADPAPAVVVAIDCRPGAVPGALVWELGSQELDVRLRDELRERAEALARALAATATAPGPAPASGEAAG